MQRKCILTSGYKTLEKRRIHFQRTAFTLDVLSATIDCRGIATLGLVFTANNFSSVVDTIEQLSIKMQAIREDGVFVHVANLVTIINDGDYPCSIDVSQFRAVRFLYDTTGAFSADINTEIVLSPKTWTQTYMSVNYDFLKSAASAEQLLTVIIPSWARYVTAIVVSDETPVANSQAAFRFNTPITTITQTFLTTASQSGSQSGEVNSDEILIRATAHAVNETRFFFRLYFWSRN